MTPIVGLVFMLAQGPKPATPAPDAGKIISGVLARYHGLDSLVGTIKYVVSADAKSGNVTESINTDIQYEKPSKLYLRQERAGSRAKTWLVTSDGKQFSYNVPEGILRQKDERLVEAVGSNDFVDVYKACLLSIGDRSIPLGIAMNYIEDLRRTIAEWPEYAVAGEETVQGVKVWKIVGKFKDTPTGPILGDFTMLVSKDNDLLQYSTSQLITAPPDKKHGADLSILVNLRQTWTCNLHPNGTPNQDLFKVIW